MLILKPCGGRVVKLDCVTQSVTLNQEITLDRVGSVRGVAKGRLVGWTFAAAIGFGSILAVAASGESGSFPASGQATCWNTGGQVIACAGTGQDGESQAGVPLAYRDNGDGTITDLNTGLMWEKLSDDGSIHDKDNYYTWTAAVSSKIAALNSANYAGHNDWRLPNVRELESIVNYETTVPAVSPDFNTCWGGCSALTCSCTISSNYWSSSTFADFPAYAWLVDFYGGGTSAVSKTGSYYVRAVRGGS